MDRRTGAPARIGLVVVAASLALLVNYEGLIVHVRVNLLTTCFVSDLIGLRSLSCSSKVLSNPPDWAAESRIGQRVVLRLRAIGGSAQGLYELWLRDPRQLSPVDAYFAGWAPASTDLNKAITIWRDVGIPSEVFLRLRHVHPWNADVQKLKQLAVVASALKPSRGFYGTPFGELVTSASEYDSLQLREEACSLYRLAATQEPPSSVYHWWWKGEAARIRGNLVDADYSYKRAVSIEPANRSLRRAQVMALYTLNAWDRALEEALRWRSSFPHDREASLMIGSIFYRTGKMK